MPGGLLRLCGRALQLPLSLVLLLDLLVDLVPVHLHLLHVLYVLLVVLLLIASGEVLQPVGKDRVDVALVLDGEV